MQPIERFFRIFFLLIKHIPPVPIERLVMPVIFITTWTLLQLLSAPAETAFVYGFVFAASAQIWKGIPRAVRRPSSRGLTWVYFAVPFTMIFGVIALQFWALDPKFSQRTLSCAYGIYCTFCLWSLADDELRDMWMPLTSAEGHLDALRRHIVKVQILMGVLGIGVNESLIVVDAPLGMRVAVLAMLPIMVHYVREATLLLTAQQAPKN